VVSNITKLETNWTFRREEEGWERQARTGRNQKRDSAVCKISLACSTLGSSAAMLTVVMYMKKMTQSVAISSLNILHGKQAGQGNWQCGLPAEFIDTKQMSVQELIVMKRMLHTTHDGHHRN